MSSLLIAETPLQVLPTLACRIGLYEAIVLQQVHYLSLRAKDAWVQKSVAEWGEVFDFIPKRSIERAFSRLREQGLLLSEVIPGGGRRSRVRVDYDALDALVEPPEYPVYADDESPLDAGKANRQIGGTKPPNWRDQTAKLAGPNRQIGGRASCNVGKAELKAEQSSSNSVSAGDAIDVVWSVWVESTQPAGTVVLTAKRRRIIRRAIDSHGLDDCTAAVRGWQHSPHHRGENKDRRVYNSIELLLRDAEHVEMFRDLERRHGGGGNVAGDCPGFTPPPALAELWASLTAQLAELVPESTHDIWLKPLHLHGEHDGRLVLAAAPHICTWVSDRYMTVLEQAAGDRKVTVVPCDLVAA